MLFVGSQYSMPELDRIQVSVLGRGAGGNLSLE
jgi:hypothetical protein